MRRRDIRSGPGDDGGVEELKITEHQRRAAIRRALRGGGKARVNLTAGQRNALRQLGLTPRASLRTENPQASARVDRT